MAARIIALLVAVGMVVGAYTYRSSLAGSDDGPGQATGTPRIVCATELEAACRAMKAKEDLAITVEAAATTADRLTSAAPDAAGIPDAWLVPGPWPTMVDEARRAAGRPPLFAPLGEPVARTVMLLVARAGNAGAGQPCLTGAATWRCVGDAATAATPFRLSGPDPTSATSVVAYGALAGAFLGDPDFASNDLSSNPDAVRSLTSIRDRIITTRSQQARSIDRFVVTPAVAEGFITTEAEWAKATFGAANLASFGVFVLSPAATSDLFVGARVGTRGSEAAKVLRSDDSLELIRQQGWRVPGREVLANMDQKAKLPADDGLPSAGVLHALREVL